jgi:DNA polymerase-3 subunit epsilon
MMDLKLERPLIFFDLETTGTVIQKDRIVEISVVKVFPDGKQQVHTRKLNPEMPIPKAASDVHGITDEDVKDAPTFQVVAENLYKYFENCDLGGYNILKFDIPVLIAEFKRAGIDFSVEDKKVVDVFNIFCKLFPRTLTAAYKFFCGKELADAHSAEADTLATLDVLFGQLEKYPELPRDMDGLHDFSDMTDPDAVDKAGRFKWSGDEVVVNFGKNSGTPLKVIAENDPGFLKWIVSKDFPEDTKDVARDALMGVLPKRRQNEEEA